MRLVKLTQRHKLGQAGFPYALQFNSPHNKTAEAMRQYLWELYGQPHYVYNERWYINGKRKEEKWAKFTSPLRNGCRKHWIGFMNEADITTAILKVT